jgi:hypothetical protein
VDEVGDGLGSGLINWLDHSLIVAQNNQPRDSCPLFRSAELPINARCRERY